jgi:hypothetical protein
VPYRYSRLTLQLQQPMAASGIVLLVLPVRCAGLSPSDDACRTLAIGSQVKALELGALRVAGGGAQGALPPAMVIDSGTPPQSVWGGARSSRPSSVAGSCTPCRSGRSPARGLSSSAGSLSPARALVGGGSISASYRQRVATASATPGNVRLRP